MMPKRLLRSSRPTSSAVTRSGEMWVILRPRNSAKGGCLWAASFICIAPRGGKKSKGSDLKARALVLQSRFVLTAWLRHDANIRARRLEALRPYFLGFLVADRTGDDDILALFPVCRCRDTVFCCHLE